jgi:hypothetical protein
VRLGGGATLSYDRLVVTVGSTIRAGAIERYDEAAMQVMPHAWKACGQTLTLRRQLESMPDGGLFVMAAPPDPFPCPPAPYERVSLIVAYFKQYKPRSKITVLDAKDTFAGRIYSRMPIVGYTAGPSIASTWGLRRSSSPRRSATAEPDANVSDRSPAARRAYAQMPLAPAPNLTSGPTAAPPVPVGNLIRLASEAESRNVSIL